MVGILQDQDALEAIQAGYDELGPDLREISVKADAAAVSARHILARIGQGAAPHEKVAGPVPVAIPSGSEAH